MTPGPDALTTPLMSVRGADGRCRPALLAGGRVVDVAAVAAALGVDLVMSDGPGLHGLLDAWDVNEPALAELAGRTSLGGEGTAWDLGPFAVGDRRIAAPVPAPEKLLFAGANYLRHVIEDAGRFDAGTERAAIAAAPTDPYMFIKLPLCVSGPYDPIVRPAGHEQLDYEVELAVVIGRGGRDIAAADALRHVAGYVLCNDVSSRDRTLRADWPFLKTDWFSGKNFETAAPLGPFLLPTAAVADWRDVRLQLSVDGELRQDDRAGEMTFGVEEQIAFASRQLPLRPGDVIATGTPAGSGFRDGRYLQPGDVVEASAGPLGTQRTVVRDAVVAAPALG